MTLEDEHILPLVKLHMETNTQERGLILLKYMITPAEE